MARDVVIRWKERVAPKREILCIVEDFFNGAAVIEWVEDRWVATLPGRPRHSLSRVASRAFPTRGDERWIEVWPDPDEKCLYITTRMQDCYTNCLAAGLAAVVARWYQAEIEPE